MKYLMVKKPGSEPQYLTLNAGQENRINSWFKEGNVRPKKFTLNNQEVLAEHILGFTDDVPPVKNELGKGYASFRQIGEQLKSKSLPKDQINATQVEDVRDSPDNPE